MHAVSTSLLVQPVLEPPLMQCVSNIVASQQVNWRNVLPLQHGQIYD